MEPMEKLAYTGLIAVGHVDEALRNLGLISYMAAKQQAEEPELILKHDTKNGKVRQGKAKRKSPQRGYWTKMTKAERSAEMRRRQEVRRVKRQAQAEQNYVLQTPPVAD